MRAVVADSAGTRAESTTEAQFVPMMFSPTPDQFVSAPAKGRYGELIETNRIPQPPKLAKIESKNPFDRFDAEWAARRQDPIHFTSAPQTTESSAQEQASAVQTPKEFDSGETWPVDREPTQSFKADKPRPFEPERRDSLFSTASMYTNSAPFDPVPPKAQRTIDRHVNSRDFEFDYELSQTGQWGVSEVELWGSEDDGATWRRFAIDSDRQSPIHVTVPCEGVYGFKILVESIGGLAPTPPRPGDEPEVTVRVDLHKPGVVMTRVEQGLGYMADQVTIAWRLDEEYPAESGVDLFYSNRSTGPWQPIATNVASGSPGHVGLGGAGQYSWRLQRHLPNKVFVRIEARDQAGNVGVAVSEGPIEISVPNPSGALLGVRAVAE